MLKFSILVAGVAGMLAMPCIVSADHKPTYVRVESSSVAPTPKPELPRLYEGDLKGHTAAIAAVAISRDSKLIASASHDGTVKLWDASTGKERLTIQGFKSCVGSVALHPEGKFVVATCAGSPVPGTPDLTAIKIWDTVTGELKLSLKAHEKFGTKVAYSPDGKVLASGSLGEAKLWDASTGRELHTLAGHQGWINTVMFRDDGKVLATKCNDGWIKLWDVATGKELASLRGPGKGEWHMAFRPDGKSIASLTDGNIIRIYDMTPGKENHFQERHKFTADKQRVTAMAYSPDGKSLATSGDDTAIRLWDIATGEETKSLNFDSDAVNSIVFSPDGNILFSAGSDMIIRTRNLANANSVRPVK